jgi:hypothetical protein
MTLIDRIKNCSIGRDKWEELLSGFVMVFVFLTCAYAFRDEKPALSVPIAGSMSAAAFIRPPLNLLHPKIVGVDEHAAPDGALVFILYQAAPKYPASVVSDLAIDSMEIAQKLKVFYRNIENPSVRFITVAPVKPGVGFEHTQIISLNFDTSTLMALPQDSTYVFQDFLNNSTGVSYIASTGQRYVGAFCRDSASARANLFCRREPS